MARWTDHDSDDERLPEGVRRVGYDSDTQRYTFEDSNGNLYQGPAGARYGMLTPHGSEPRGMTLEEAEAIKAADRDSWRYFLPFILLVIVTLFLLFRLINSGSAKEAPLACVEGSHRYTVKSGDTCWDIAQKADTTLDRLSELNPTIDCGHLRVGTSICEPDRH